MSLKPPKKSDLAKSWMKDRRDKARMIQPEYHLIASEGTETEPQYFGAIQRIIYIILTRIFLGSRFLFVYLQKRNNHVE